jgi:hypothetical protein
VTLSGPFFVSAMIVGLRLGKASMSSARWFEKVPVSAAAVSLCGFSLAWYEMSSVVL